MTNSTNHADMREDNVTCAIITVSDTRTMETDTSGDTIQRMLEEAGYRIISREILPDEPECVRGRVEDLARDQMCRAVLLTGGTGVAARDTTYEALDGILEKHLDGFGELFRMLSYEQIGAAAMLSRALAGVLSDTVIFSMPGSTAAVELAMGKLIVPQLGHVVALLGRSN